MMLLNNDTQQLEQFVSHTFGLEQLSELKNIYQGGQNNSKGNLYEQYYLVFKAFQIASQDNLDLTQHYLQSQTYAFVDDLCYIDKQNSIKHNYQAKNSSHSSANWTDEMQKRFLYQKKIDLDFFKFKQSKNYFLVSDLEKAKSNQKKIQQSDEHNDFSCEFFPYYQQLSQLLADEEFKSYIDQLIMPNATPADRDFAVRLIQSALGHHQKQSIDDIFNKAQSDAYPNPFIKFRPQLSNEIPQWLQETLTQFQSHISYTLQYGKLNVIFNHVLNVSIETSSLSQRVKPTQAITTPSQLASLLMSFAQLTPRD